MVLGGLFKIAIAGVLAWAWFNGHLASIAGRATGLVAGGSAATPTSFTSPTSSSTTGSVA